MYSARDVVGNIAVGTTILQFLSGVLVCKTYVVQRSTAETSSLPFVCGVLSAALWLLYGLTIEDGKIVFVNTVGVILMLTYSIIFYKCTSKKSTVLYQFYTTFVLFCFVLVYISIELNVDQLVSRLGAIASFLTLLTIAAPMNKLFYVIRVKSTECLPFPMILMSFVVSTLWYCYGRIEEDVFITNVNLIGAGLAVLQLLLFVIYPSKPHTSTLSQSILA